MIHRLELEDNRGGNNCHINCKWTSWYDTAFIHGHGGKMHVATKTWQHSQMVMAFLWKWLFVSHRAQEFTSKVLWKTFRSLQAWPVPFKLFYLFIEFICHLSPNKITQVSHMNLMESILLKKDSMTPHSIDFLLSWSQHRHLRL